MTKNHFLSLCLALSAGIHIAAAGELSNKEIEHFLMNYYRQPNPDKIAKIITIIDRRKLLRKNNTVIMMTGFSCFFNRYNDAQKSYWIKIIDQLSQSTRKAFGIAISNKPERLFARVKPSPVKNDMNWGCFFATGDTKYIQKVIDVLPYIDERTDISLYMTAASAKWSLASNMKTHPIVRQVVEKTANANNGKLSKIANDILEKSDKQIHQETIELLKKQRQADAWR